MSILNSSSAIHALVKPSLALIVFRFILVYAQAATIFITWELWQVRVNPPMLPALAIPSFNIAVWLLASLGLALLVPRVGIIAHALLLLLAMLQDQTRMQPECISLALLLFGTLGGDCFAPSPPGTPGGEGRGEGGQGPCKNVTISRGMLTPSPPSPLSRSTGGEGRNAQQKLDENTRLLSSAQARGEGLSAPTGAGWRLLARSHLVALWFYAGLHKLISPGYYERIVPWLFGGALGGASSTVYWSFGVAAACFEMSLGILALIPRTRKIAAVLAFVFHLGIFVRLFADKWNPAVWPWNVAIAFAGFVFLWDWQSSPVRSWLDSRWLTRLATLFVLLSPLGFYVNLIDAYPAHCLYSANVPTAIIRTEDGGQIEVLPMVRMNVPMPPEHRLFEAYFQRVRQPGDVLVIDDPRWWARFRGYEHREIE